MKRFLIIIALCGLAITGHAQTQQKVSPELRKTIVKLLRKTVSMPVVFDMSETFFCKMTREEFAAANGGPTGISITYLDAVLRKYENVFCNQRVSRMWLSPVSECKEGLALRITVSEITEKGGVTATATLVYDDSIVIAHGDLSVEDGRWNSFDKLLLENAQKQFKRLCFFLHGARDGGQFMPRGSRYMLR